MISAFCMFLNISILTVPGYTAVKGFHEQIYPHTCVSWHRSTWPFPVWGILPLHPEHWMKKLMRSSRARSLSCLYDSIHSSTTDCWSTRVSLTPYIYIYKLSVSLFGQTHMNSYCHSPAWHSCPFWPLQTEWPGQCHLHCVEQRHWLYLGLLPQASSCLWVTAGVSYWPTVIKNQDADKQMNKSINTWNKEDFLMTVPQAPLTCSRTCACFPGLPLFFFPFTSGSSISLMFILKPTVSVAPDSLDESLREGTNKSNMWLKDDWSSYSSTK